MAAVTRSASASPSISLHSSVDASLFPLRSIGDVVRFFRRALEQPGEPDLTLLSIIAGYIELSLTTGNAAQVAAAAASAAENNAVAASPAATLAGIAAGGGLAGAAAASNADIIMSDPVPFPVVTHELVAGLYKKFQSIMSVVEKPKAHSHNRPATRELIKKVSDVIWHSLIRSSYKDRAHLQNLYCYLASNKLDCFGVALAVVAGCQMLGYKDVRLAIAEDHAWVIFGSKRPESIEVTWHGKGSEDKRGQDVSAGVDSGSWLYLGGHPVVCDRYMEVAAIVSAINISLTSNSDCVEVSELQQKLLWLMYDMGHLQKYPMGLGSLGELEEINPTHESITCDQLYRESIQAAREHYANHHVYPYTYQGNYYNRLLKYREAFAAWANAADVIRLYTYSCRDDEEIYKELLDIANEMIPYVIKTESSGHSARSILRDSEVFANLLRFYDGICQWEEDSLTPILHIGWAKPLVNNITKFDYDIRSQVVIQLPEEEAAEKKRLEAKKEAVATEPVVVKAEDTNEAKRKEPNNGQAAAVEGNNNNNLVKKEEKPSGDGKKTDMPTTLADLTAACGEKILNPQFLLQGGGQPFADQTKQRKASAASKTAAVSNNNNNKEPNGLEKANSSEAVAATNGSEAKAAEPRKARQDEEESSASKNETKVKAADPLDAPISPTSPQVPSSTTSVPPPKPSPSLDVVKAAEEDPFEFMMKRPVITLYSQKMKGLKNLLLAEKLNTHAISLQVTAQSVASKKIRGIDKLGNHTTSSMYATVNVTAAASAAAANSSGAASSGGGVAAGDGGSAGLAVVADSIAASRPKRTRRE